MHGYRNWRIAFAASLLVAAPLGLTTANAQDMMQLTVAVPNPSAINNFPLFVAMGEGYFEEEGLELTVEALNGSAAVLQVMASGQAQIGNPGPGPLLSARARGEDVVFIYNQYPKSIFGLMVPEESEAQGPADLDGTTVGVGTADGAEVAFTRGILQDAGLTEGENYEFLTVGDGGTAAAAFLGEEVDAYAAAVSDAAIIESRGIPLREITPEEYLSFFGNGWAVTGQFIEENPEAVEGFGRALVRATRFGLDPANREKVLEHTTAGNPQEGEDTEFANALLDAVMERIQPVDDSNGYGYQPPEHWEAWHQSQLDTGGLAEPLENLEEAYNNDFVEAWNAE
ncbi:ABC transporter substrate-binding protein [Rhizobium sp. EC-SD404]|uniref:ABC transporter substrate-binding protein n=1 Tax=Rhizobium sp. EC-SD404 TaxID=2038389 RepID=UPI00125413CC|nr:ABC transporter substrate-binding protein [Rhizobium sp. EC-SD404]VVT16671.1 ABC transporter substrate-binding protein [Rhizobium sp. EC-SD404]